MVHADSFSQSNGSRGMNKRRGWKAIEKEKMEAARNISPQSYQASRKNLLAKKSYAGDTDIDDLLSRQHQRKTITKSENTNGT